MASGFVSGQTIAAPRLYFDPASHTTTKDSDFQIILKIDVENKSAFGADAVINFPPGDISVKPPTNGGFFSDFSYAQSLGKLEIHGFFSTLYESKSGSGNFAVLTFSSNKESGSGTIDMTCPGTGPYTEILDSNGQNILNCNAINLLSLTYSGSGGTTTPLPTNSPENPSTNACGGTCGSNYNCNSGLFCFQGFCRNPFCSSDSTCECKATPTPTPKPKTVVNPTPQIVALTKFTPFPTLPPTEVPTPVETPEPSQNSTFKNLALWAGLLALGVAAVFIIIKVLKRRKGPPKITPPSPIQTFPVSPPFPPTDQT